MTFVARINNDEDFKLGLKQIYTSEGATYQFKLCCPAIIELEHNCPKEITTMVYFRIPKCVIIDNIVFDVKVDQVEYKGSNLTMCTNLTVTQPGDKKDCVYLGFEVDSVLNINKLCIQKMCIPVTPKCYNNEQIEVSFSNFGKFVCYEPDEMN